MALEGYSVEKKGGLITVIPVEGVLSSREIALMELVGEFYANYGCLVPGLERLFSYNEVQEGNLLFAPKRNFNGTKEDFAILSTEHFSGGGGKLYCNPREHYFAGTFSPYEDEPIHLGPQEHCLSGNHAILPPEQIQLGIYRINLLLTSAKH